MKASWGAFASTGDPGWPASGVWSLQPGGGTPISGFRYVAEHRCDFWDGRPTNLSDR